VQQIVLDSSFSLTVTPSQLSLQTQHHTSFILTATPLGTFRGSVALNCGSLPLHATCRLSSPSLMLTSLGQPQSTSVYFDTSDVIGYAANEPPLMGHPTGKFLAAFFFPSFVLLSATTSRFRRSRAMRALIVVISLMAAVSLSAGCSGKYPASVAPGVYTLQFLGTSSTAVTQTATVTLTVTP
jgi:hypothetical protein